MPAPGFVMHMISFCLHLISISWCQVLHPVVWAQAQKNTDQLSIRLLQNGGGLHLVKPLSNTRNVWIICCLRFDQDVETSYATLARDSLKASWFRLATPSTRVVFSNLCNNFHQNGSSELEVLLQHIPMVEFHVEHCEAIDVCSMFVDVRECENYTNSSR